MREIAFVVRLNSDENLLLKKLAENRGIHQADVIRQWIHEAGNRVTGSVAEPVKHPAAKESEHVPATV